MITLWRNQGYRHPLFRARTLGLCLHWEPGLRQNGPTHPGLYVEQVSLYSLSSREDPSSLLLLSSLLQDSRNRKGSCRHTQAGIYVYRLLPGLPTECHCTFPPVQHSQYPQHMSAMPALCESEELHKTLQNAGTESRVLSTGRGEGTPDPGCCPREEGRGLRCWQSPMGRSWRKGSSLEPGWLRGEQSALLRYKYKHKVTSQAACPLLN